MDERKVLRMSHSPKTIDQVSAVSMRAFQHLKAKAKSVMMFNRVMILSKFE
jgi:hypothetical protein